jgi:membrane-associated phospholipid phosphatase
MFHGIHPVVRGEQFFSRPRTAVWTGLALVALVGVVAALIPGRPLAVDLRWAEAMRDIETGRLHDLALALNYLGRGLGRAVSLAAVGLVLIVARRWRALIAFAVTESLTPLSVNLLKQLVDRPRPPGAMIEATGSSFPSGHAAYAGATAISLLVLLTRPGTRQRRAWAVVAAVVVAGMVWSRTYLQAHWLTDAISGAVLGLGVALAAFAAVQIRSRYGASSG